VGDGGAEGSSAIGDGGQAAVSFTPDIEGTGGQEAVGHSRRRGQSEA